MAFVNKKERKKEKQKLDPGAGEPGGPGGMWGPWICEFVLGFLTFALVWSG